MCTYSNYWYTLLPSDISCFIVIFTTVIAFKLTEVLRLTIDRMTPLSNLIIIRQEGRLFTDRFMLSVDDLCPTVMSQGVQLDILLYLLSWQILQPNNLPVSWLMSAIVFWHVNLRTICMPSTWTNKNLTVASKLSWMNFVEADMLLSFPLKRRINESDIARNVKSF